MIQKTADALGADVADTLDAMTLDVGTRLSLEVLRSALERCRVELKGHNGFPPRLTTADILERAGFVTEAELQDLEAVAAFDFVMELMKKHARWADGEMVLGRHVTKADPDCAKCLGSGLALHENDGKGHRFAADCDCRTYTPAPQVPERVLSTVRRMGGWEMFYDLTPSKHPFVRRDFIAEFHRAAKLENVLMLPAGTRHGRLTAPIRGYLSGIRKELEQNSVA